MEDFFAAIEDYWPAGRDDYHWHVLPGSELLRDRVSRPYEEIIRQPGLVPEPIRAWLTDNDAAEIPLAVTELVLVSQRHNRGQITFRVLEHVPLDGQLTAP